MTPEQDKQQVNARKSFSGSFITVLIMLYCSKSIKATIKRREVTMAKQDELPDNPGIIAPPPLIYAGPLAVGLLLNLKFPMRFLPRKVARILGLTLIGTSVILVSQAFQRMMRAGTNVNPTEPTTVLVTEGPFKYTRNPLYLSLTLFYAGVAALANALWTMLLLPAVLFVINRGVIDREERYLERKFGEQYIQYKERVRRWI
jgi:protein-S-isoprenylcysteine O-methyltransferase Ste14